MRPGEPGSAGCDCPLVLGFLRDIGAAHSARMHERPDLPWSPRDWSLHHQEEERYLFPRLLRAFPELRGVVRSLVEEHRAFEADPSAVPAEVRQRHAEIEDRLVARLLAHDSRG